MCIWRCARNFCCPSMRCGDGVGAHSKHAAHFELFTKLNYTRCKVIPSRVWFGASQQQDGFVVGVVAKHDFWCSPVQLFDYPLAQLHQWSASPVVNKGVAIKLNQRYRIGFGNQRFHCCRSSCTCIDPARQHGDQNRLLKRWEFAVEIGGNSVIGHFKRQCRRESNCSAFCAAVSTWVLKASNA